MNKSYLYQATLAACLFLGACSGDKTESGQLEVIPLGAGGVENVGLFQEDTLCPVGDDRQRACGAGGLGNCSE